MHWAGSEDSFDGAMDGRVTRVAACRRMDGSNGDAAAVCSLTSFATLALDSHYLRLLSIAAMPGVYGGDDVSAVVFDAGSSLLRGGWAGEDSPRVVIPSSYGWVPSDENDASSSSAAPAPAPSAAAEGDGDATMAEGNGDAPKEEQAVKTEAADSRIRGAKYLAKKATPDKGKKRFFGDFGVRSYRKGMEISPTVVDGIGE